MKNRWKALLGAAVLAAASLMPTTQTANAAHYDAVCNHGEACFYYNSKAHGLGSMADFYVPIPSFRTMDYRFVTEGNGRGYKVWNNAAHVENRWKRDGRVYENSYYQGGFDTVGKYSSRDLFLTKNDNASWKWV
ncbi:hypothetical protein [Arachnia propionica]|uniref:Peptidase inhibitor family I36 n=1 Tax=Arachnia propionica TaxID=1750 RepID=A0A3P1WTQ0_9ACTN|nr:hypothetical protein [Arachnia propionica]RRD49969.1 hypothetical protein EII35_06275 [Arachnia propionica]